MTSDVAARPLERTRVMRIFEREREWFNACQVQVIAREIKFFIWNNFLGWVYLFFLIIVSGTKLIGPFGRFKELESSQTMQRESEFMWHPLLSLTIIPLHATLRAREWGQKQYHTRPRHVTHSRTAWRIHMCTCLVRMWATIDWCARHDSVICVLRLSDMCVKTQWYVC